MNGHNSKKILLEECPSFNQYGFDTDIGLYISLINNRKYALAKTLYDKKLAVRYPDEKNRIEIIRYYRRNDPRFRDVYLDSVRELVERIILSVKKIIDHIAWLFEGNTSNPYELLKKIDRALQIVPTERSSAERFIRKLSRYSVLLNYNTEKFMNGADILGRYFDNTLFVKKTVRPKTERKKGKTGKSDIAEEKKKITIDLDAVEFSEKDISMICINSAITKRTYQVIAYCRHYWKQVYNHDFEKKIFLYSKKYSTRHFKIFSLIKNGRIKKLSDDVILLELYCLISNGYQYSISEDLLMQRLWKKIKPVDQIVRKKTSRAYSPPVISLPVAEKREKSEKKKKPVKQPASTGGKIHIKDIGKQSLRKKLDLLSFREVFDAHAVFDTLLPGYVEKYLVKHRRKESGKDPYVLKGAKYIILNYIKNNYDSIIHDWNGSLEKKEVTNIGFIVPEIETIIALCLEEVRMRRASV